MTRTFIAAVLAFLVLAPAASARLIDEPPAAGGDKPLVQSERITDTGGKPLVQSELITDHRAAAPTSSLAGTTEQSAGALAQEAYYKSQGHALAALATRTIAGGAAPAPMDAMLVECRSAVATARSWIDRERAATERAEGDLVALARN